ncbi:MAG: 30S ribosomal protein S16 [Minisyncoccia bacterium]
MLAIKLQRTGRKHQPSYRLVVAEKRSKMAGPPVEDLGSYNTFTKVSTINKERISHWLKIGAQPTVTVHNFLVKEGVLTGAKMPIKMKKAVVAPAPAPSAAPVVVAPAAETPAAPTE